MLTALAPSAHLHRVAAAAAVVLAVAACRPASINARSADDAVTVASLHGVSAGPEHSCGLDADGRAYCWGRGDYGRLGLGDSAARVVDRPMRVAAGELRFVQVSAGSAHSCALTADGAIYCWGLDIDGQLGAPTASLCDGFPCSPRPTRVESGLRFRSVGAGLAHSCALAEDGRAFCWGRGDRGELGTARLRPACAGVPCSVAPVAVQTALRFDRLSVRAHSCGLSDGRAYCWGPNDAGQLGAVAAGAWSAEPRAVAAGERFVDVRAGWERSCAVTAGGWERCWGGRGAVASAEGKW